MSTVGRDRELEGIAAFLESGAPARVLLIEGEAGIGKTTLWRVGVSEARERGYRVLSAEAAQAESHLSLTALREPRPNCPARGSSGQPMTMDVVLTAVAP